ncbi:MAG: hypothetical protein ACRDIY_04305, partial [Chloroflexota bacterium]
MRSRREGSDKINRLTALESAPDEQYALALDFLEREKGLQVVQAALRVLAEHPRRDAHPAVRRQYAFRDADGNRRDPGGYIRSDLLKILRQPAHPDDLPLFERGAWTYEFMPGADEVCSSVRANAVIAMSEVDPALASYHCVRLLTDRHTSKMSGEPAVTAARILASQSRFLPLYAYVMGDGAASEAVSECLRSLTSLPESLLTPLIEKLQKSEDEIALIGLFDLILGHPASAAHHEFVRRFLRATRLEDVHRYLVTAIVAQRKQGLIADLIDQATEEANRRKQENLLDALSLIDGDARAAAAVRTLRTALQRRPG